VNVVVPGDLSVSHAAVEVCVAQVAVAQKICSPTVDLATNWREGGVQGQVSLSSLSAASLPTPTSER